MSFILIVTVNMLSRIIHIRRHKFLLGCSFSIIISTINSYIWDKVFKNGPSKICEKQPLIPSNFLKAVFHKFYLVQYFVPFFDQLRNVNMTFPCNIYKNTIASNHNAICCDISNKWVHISCNNISRYNYTKLQNDSTPWYCQNCLKKVLSFNKLSDYQLKALLSKTLTSPQFLSTHNYLLFQIKNAKM